MRMHELKKYPNRRLYDMTDSRYVTIGDVRKLISMGESIHVVDSRDDEDITRAVLLQILAEQEAEGHESVLTNRVIEQLIRFYGDSMSGIVGRYIEQGMLTVLDHQDQLRNHLRQFSDMHPMNLMRRAFEATDPTNQSPDGSDDENTRKVPAQQDEPRK